MSDFDFELTIRFECAGHTGDPVYLIGTLNDWRPEGVFLGYIPEGQHKLKVRIADVPEGPLEFRLSRGGWSAISCRTDGTTAAPFIADVKANTVSEVSVAAWSDDFPVAATAEQVYWLSEAFFFPELKAYRKVWVYLPKSYAYTGRKRYPVLYMHDGQHLFEEAAAVGRKGPVGWQVDKAINAAAAEAIVVAIAHGGGERDRLHDYVVEPVSEMPEPAGREYLADIIHTLKPYVDAHYRTRADRRHTAMAGSSLGGLLSLYAGLMHADNFACLGVFSPSLWLDNKQVDAFIKASAETEQERQSYFLYGGSLENLKIQDIAPVAMDKNIEAIGKLLSGRLQANAAVDINPVGKHGTLYWQQAFPRFYEWWWEQMEQLRIADSQAAVQRKNGKDENI